MRRSRLQFVALALALAGVVSCHDDGGEDEPDPQFGVTGGPISDWPDHSVDAGSVPANPVVGPGSDVEQVPPNPSAGPVGGSTGGGAAPGTGTSGSGGAGGGTAGGGGTIGGGTPSFDAGAVPPSADAGSAPPDDAGAVDADAADAGPDADADAGVPDDAARPPWGWGWRR